ncbi:hypothetical protein C0416_03140 [bacterium]|nr:hypothetical protein [bacterium]
MRNKQKRHISIFAWIGLVIYTFLSAFLVELNFTNFQTSVVPTKTAPAFDGTTAPIKKAPNWVALKTEEFKMTYDELNQKGKLIAFPTYNADNLKISTNSLTWGNSAHDAIRNQKITFSVPYMGNYLLDGQEYAGGHLAVDIKTPSGTPVYAIGNGIVNKTSEQLSGFGKHIVVEHKNFPSYNNPSQKTTYYSSYSHLSVVSVAQGDIVRKGDLIGYSGNTGTSTTPHLHFQIDTTSAPWHPYWHFTSKEASDAGLTFTQAINSGLNKDIAIKNTINPVLYVQKYASSTMSTLPETTQPVTETVTEPVTQPVTETVTTQPVVEPVTKPVTEVVPETTVTETVTSDEKPTEDFVTFEIDSQSTFRDNEEFTVKITAVNSAGVKITNYVPATPVRIELIRGQATISPTRLGSSDFKNGVATLTISPRNNTPLQFAVKTDTVIKESPVVAEGLFLDVNVVHPHFEAISFLKNEGIIQGYPDGSFKPNNSVSRVEVLKFILEGIDAEIAGTRALPFSDTQSEAWYADYLQTAVYLGVVNGYPDGSFKPGNTVNKVEFLKMLIEAMDVEINTEIGYMPFSDVKKNDWYAKYVQFAYQKNIIEADGKKFNPQEQMTRENVAEAIYRVQVLTQTGAASFNSQVAESIAT